jgi:hypothetical protein
MTGRGLEDRGSTHRRGRIFLLDTTDRPRGQPRIYTPSRRGIWAQRQIYRCIICS